MTDDRETRDKRIGAILGHDDDDDDWDFERDAKVFYEHLQANLRLPCEVTGSEDFRWEEPYVLGAWPAEGYEELKKTQPSYEDHYELLEIDRSAISEWQLFQGEDIGAIVRRISDGREFCLGLSELEATDKSSANHQLIEDYAVWLVNSR